VFVHTLLRQNKYRALCTDVALGSTRDISAFCHHSDEISFFDFVLGCPSFVKRIFLTGASSGIGLAIAQALVARGDEVWGTSRKLGRIPQLARIAEEFQILVFGHLQLIRLALKANRRRLDH
jgi:hypothetical protein